MFNFNKFIGETADPFVIGAYGKLTPSGQFSDVFLPEGKSVYGRYIGSRNSNFAYEFFTNPATNQVIFWECEKYDHATNRSATLYVGGGLPIKVNMIYPNLLNLDYSMVIGKERITRDSQYLNQVIHNPKAEGVLRSLTDQFQYFQRIGFHHRGLSNKHLADLVDLNVIENSLYRKVEQGHWVHQGRDVVINTFLNGIKWLDDDKKFELVNKFEEVLNK